MANKRLNVSINEKAHKVIERYKFDNNLITKDDAVEKILIEFGNKMLNL